MPTKNHSKQFFLILFFSLLSFLFCAHVLAAEPVDDLDIGIWHFDETDNANAEDFSSYNHDLAWNSNPWGGGNVFPPRARGKFDMGINFTQNEERYGLENFGSIDLSSGITLGAWIKTEVNTDEKVRILWLGNYRNSRIQDPTNFIMLSVQNGQVHLDLKQNKEWEREIVSGKIVNDNEWHFLTFTLDPTTQKMTLYVDGQFQSQSSFDLPIPILEMLSIGMREYYYDSGTLNNSGIIDDVWLRQEPLSGEKINDIFQSGQAYKFDTLNYDLAPPSVFVNYDFDKINGTVALDSSANHYDIFWGYNMYSPGASPTPRLVPGKFEQGVNFKKDWETYSRKFDPIKNFSQGFSSGIWIKTNEINELPARIFWIGEEPKGRMDEAAFSDYLAVTEVDGKIKVDLNFYDGYFQDGRIMFKRQYSLNSKTFISDDTWHHVALTIDSRPNVRAMKLYIDGILEDTSFFPGLIPPVDKLALGHREYTSCGTEYNFNGTEDDFFIMNSVISDKDVKDIYESNSAFTWPIRRRNPVIIVPGIMGSSLNMGDLGFYDMIWPNPLEYISDPLDNRLKELKMNDFGNSIYRIEPRDIIRDVGGVDFYGSLIEYLKSQGYEEDKDLFVFPYDWRRDISITSGYGGKVQGVVTLEDKIEDIKETTGANKIDVIAHSLGGLVVKSYVKKFGQDSIDRFIDIATPHLGSPDAMKILNYGDSLGILLNLKITEYAIFNSDTIKDISQNYPAVYQLLPSQRYFNLPGSEYSNYIYNDGTVADTSRGNLSYSQSLDYLSKTGDENRLSFVNTSTLFHAAIDSVEIDNSYNIVGCGMPTIGKIGDLGKKKFFKNKYSLEYIDGDGTVPLRSADYFGDKKYYVKGKEHSKLPGTTVVKEFIGAILNGEDDTFNYSSYSDFSQSDNICGISGKIVEFHCPVEMHIYDQSGNHVGPKENGDIEINIPGVKYDIVDGNKFVFIPNDGNKYVIKGVAEEAGALEVTISEVENNQYKKAIYFSDISLESSLSKVEFDLGDNLEGQLIKVDKEGDGVFEKTLNIDSVLDEGTRGDLIKPVTTINHSGTIGNDNYYTSNIEVVLSAEDDNSGILKTEYSLDDGQSWNIYQAPFTISEDGEHKIVYSSIDRAGNREVEKSATIKIDKTKPEILILISEMINHDQILDVLYLVNDNFSGIATGTIKFYLDDNLVSSSTIDLFYQKIGKHKIGLSIEDLAGNIGNKEIDFEIITSIESTMLDIERSAKEKLIDQKASDKLIKDLNNVKKYIDKFGKREERRDKREADLIKKCSVHNSQEWCNNKFGKIFTHINYRLNWIYGKVVKLQYNLILKDLEFYYRKNWVTKAGYDIIKNDLNYLISKI